VLEALGTALAADRPTRRPDPARPALEALEERRVPAALSAVGYYTQEDLHIGLAAIDNGTHQAVLYTADAVYAPHQFSRQNLGGPTVTDVSLGFDRSTDSTGSIYDHLHVFARDTDGTTTAFTNGAATPLGGWVSELSATQGSGRVFGIGGGGRVYVNSWYNSGWTPLGGYLQHISAGHDANGNDVVFGIGGNGAIYEHDASYDPMGWRWSLVDNSAYFTQLSAGPNGSVFAVDSAGSLHEASFVNILWYSTWADWNLGRSPGGYAVTAISAASYNNSDEVFVTDASGTAYQYTPSGWQRQSVDTHVRELSAAMGNLFFDVNYQTAWYWDGSWTPLGWVV
jgi:hypothetical protein